MMKGFLCVKRETYLHVTFHEVKILLYVIRLLSKETTDKVYSRIHKRLTYNRLSMNDE